MTMSTGMRVVLTIYLIVVICCFLFLLATMFGIIPPHPLEAVMATALRGGFWYKLLYAVICIAMIVVSFIIMFFGKRSMHRSESTISIADTGDGDIVITTRAVEELIQREVLKTTGVRGANTKVVSSGDFIDVFIHLSVAPGQDIPEMTTSMQSMLHDQLLSNVGVKIRDMKFTVTDVQETLSKAGKKTQRVV